MRFKGVRHELHERLANSPARDRFAARDTAADVGTRISTTSELSRRSIKDIAAAAASRVEQALRCLEESLKVCDPQIAFEIEQLRYRSYINHADILKRIARWSTQIEQARLYVLVDCQMQFDVFIKRINDISNAGVNIIQVRDKSAVAKTILEYTQAAIQTVAPEQTIIIVNDRIDLAVASNAAGVHLGQSDLSHQVARSMLPSDRVIGISTHNVDQVEKAIQIGADYIGCGPTFASPTKSFERFAGLKFLTQVSQRQTPPAFAIGGITLDNLDSVLATGIRRVAIASAIWQAEHPSKVATQFAERLSRAV